MMAVTVLPWPSPIAGLWPLIADRWFFNPQFAVRSPQCSSLLLTFDRWPLVFQSAIRHPQSAVVLKFPFAMVLPCVLRRTAGSRIAAQVRPPAA